MDQIQHPLLRLIGSSLQRYQLESSLVLGDVVLPLGPVIVPLRLIHYKHDSVVHTGETPLVKTGRVQFKFGLADMSFI